MDLWKGWDGLMHCIDCKQQLRSWQLFCPRCGGDVYPRSRKTTKNGKGMDL